MYFRPLPKGSSHTRLITPRCRGVYVSRYQNSEAYGSSMAPKFEKLDDQVQCVSNVNWPILRCTSKVMALNLASPLLRKTETPLKSGYGRRAVVHGMRLG